MSDGNTPDVIQSTQKHRIKPLPFEDMDHVLLDTMQGTLICLDNCHIIVNVSKTVKQYFGFEQMHLIGISILLLIEDSERDLFSKFLNNSSQTNDISCVRMMTNSPNKYHQVTIHRKKKVNQDNVDVHSTTPRHSYSIETILLITIDESSYIDISLYDIDKEEFYTKMNLLGEITFEDHRGASITGYLPHELISQSIFNIVHQDDRLVKLHALWKCVTAGSSKLQWRLIARDGTPVYLQTEYKLIADHQNHDTIVARNEVLSAPHRAQFDELQTAWRHQCAADIKGNNSSFKLISSNDIELLSTSNDECRISVPSLNMCFTTNNVNPLEIQGNIFDLSKTLRPLTIQDYIAILIDHDKFIDNELTQIIQNLQSLTARSRRPNESNESTSSQRNLDRTFDEKIQTESSSLLSSSIDSSHRRKHDSDSIVRGILNNSMKYNQQEKSSTDLSSTHDSLVNDNVRSSSSTVSSPTSINTTKPNSGSLSPTSFHQQHIEFLKKYTSAKAKLESQLESIRYQGLSNGTQTYDVNRRKIILSKLSQLEHIKEKHLARRYDTRRQMVTATVLNTPTAVPVNNPGQKDFLTNLFTSSNSIGSTSIENNNNNHHHSNNNNNNIYSSSNEYSSIFYSQQFDQGQTSSLDEFLSPPSSSSSSPFSSYVPVSNHPNSSTSRYSYMNIPFDDPSTFIDQQQDNLTYPY